MKSILPKFLWAGIIVHFSYTDILKMRLINNHFTDYVDEDKWRQLFFSRKSLIAIVKADMDNSWKHAVSTFSGCDSIDIMVNIIKYEMMDKSSTMIKIFFATGVYEIIRDYTLDFHWFDQCNVELIGCNDVSISPYINVSNTLKIINAHCVTINNIIFKGIYLTLAMKQCNSPRSVRLTNCIFDNYSYIYNDYTDMIVSNCKLGHGTMYIQSVNITITDSIFDLVNVYLDSTKSVIISNCVLTDTILNVFGKGQSGSICNISNSTIGNGSALIHVDRKSIDIILQSNNISNMSNIVYFTAQAADINIKIDTNTIKNILFCTNAALGSLLNNILVNYVNNSYSNCVSVHDGVCPIIQTSHNACIDCDPNFIKQMQ